MNSRSKRLIDRIDRDVAIWQTIDQAVRWATEQGLRMTPGVTGIEWNDRSEYLYCRSGRCCPLGAVALYYQPTWNESNGVLIVGPILGVDENWILAFIGGFDQVVPYYDDPVARRMGLSFRTETITTGK